MYRGTRRIARHLATYVAVATAATAIPVAQNSASATTLASWSLASVPAPSGGWSSINYLDGRWVALSTTGEDATSVDATTWNVGSIPDGSWHSTAYGNGRFVALSSANTVPNELDSSDALTWNTMTGPPGAPVQSGRAIENGQWNGVAYGDGLFVAVGADGVVSTSSDGVTWARRFWRPQDDFSSVTFGDGRFIAVDAAAGNVLISLDGLHWSLIRSPLTGVVNPPSGGLHLSSVVYGNGTFVAFGSGTGAGYVATSDYGYSWTLSNFQPAQSIQSATFGCGTFSAVGESLTASSSLITSTTGEQWRTESATVPTSGTWTGIAYGAHHYVGVDATGDITWTATTADCAARVPTMPQQVSGNVHNGEVWTYMHPAASPGGAPILGYRVAITDGTSTRYCGAAPSGEPNCIIRGLANHQVYWVTAQAYNRFGYSAPTDPEFVIPTATWSLSLTAPSVTSTTLSTVVQVTGIIANAAGFYPWSLVTVHVGSLIETCYPSPFGECLISLPDLGPGTLPMRASYVGYGRAYSSPIRLLDVQGPSST